MNGLADIERKELRAVSAYGFYDDPSRLLRLVRFRVRLGFTVEDRTQMQVANAREAEVEKHIPARALGDELKRISAEDSPTDIFKGAGRSRSADAFLVRPGDETEPAWAGQV
jgi:tRNA nucleotidyltransferase (CCA-adding enzyme)